MSSCLSKPSLMKLNALSEIVKSIIPITETEVAHDGIASVIHSIVAKANMAITRR